ncbi:hypothetical protein H0H93_004005 [Arthromyces matolae]|nr:hypothetical protein H0H93_004005 [Arthromyces matolae]
MLFFLLTCLALSLTASSSRLAITRPPDGQLPLIARVDKYYYWPLSSQTFTSTNGDITCTAPTLPSWLSFDPVTLAFYGTPSKKDEGDQDIIIVAKDSKSTLSTNFKLLVISDPEPTVHIPISKQFSAPAPSLSSVFTVSPNSSIKTEAPTLRIPPKWSFSIGFEYETFVSPSGVYYEARQRDGSPLPDWMEFNPEAITLNGVTPGETKISQPGIVSLALFASERKGFSSSWLPFAVVVSQHELSLKSSPSRINIASDESFSLSLYSRLDTLGVLVDGRPIGASEVTVIVVDTSEYRWLKYDRDSRTLSGDPRNVGSLPGQNILVLATLEAFNQSLAIPVSLALVASTVSETTLSPIQGTPGEAIDYDARQEVSHIMEHEVNEITVALEPMDVGEWLAYHPDSGKLTGNVPRDFKRQEITVTFTASDSRIHAISRAKLSIIFAPPEHTTETIHPLQLSATAHARLVLGLGVTFGALGGLCLFAGILAIFRRCAKVEDTAIGGEEGRNVWSERDKQWYNAGRGFGWSGTDPNFTEKPPGLLQPGTSLETRQAPLNKVYGDLGLGLRRVSERSGSEGSKQSPGFMRKSEFFTRLRETVRVVSDKVQRRKVSRERPAIGRPILPLVSGQVDVEAVNNSSTFFEQGSIPSHSGNIPMTDSPSTSTGEHSIPRRRADFAPPRSPSQTHMRLSRQLSSGSTTSNSSERTHASEAVVQTASKAMSVHSEKSSIAADSRPRLVPFTSASRVPVPHRPSSPSGPRYEGATTKRVNSQSAKVWRREPLKGGSNDDLKMGLHYVESLGADTQHH